MEAKALTTSFQNCLAFLLIISLSLQKLICRSGRRGRTGDPKTCTAQVGGVSESSEEDFFASSPSANLAGFNEEGHETSLDEVVSCASQPLFVWYFRQRGESTRQPFAILSENVIRLGRWDSGNTNCLRSPASSFFWPSVHRRHAFQGQCQSPEIGTSPSTPFR